MYRDQIYQVWCPFVFVSHRSMTRGGRRSGMSLISTSRQHRYSPSTVMKSREHTWSSHHSHTLGRPPPPHTAPAVMHPTRWSRCTVAAKSRHFRALSTTTTSQPALQRDTCMRSISGGRTLETWVKANSKGVGWVILNIPDNGSDKESWQRHEPPCGLKGDLRVGEELAHGHLFSQRCANDDEPKPQRGVVQTLHDHNLE